MLALLSTTALSDYVIRDLVPQEICAESWLMDDGTDAWQPKEVEEIDG